MVSTSKRSSGLRTKIIDKKQPLPGEVAADIEK